MDNPDEQEPTEADFQEVFAPEDLRGFLIELDAERYKDISADQLDAAYGFMVHIPRLIQEHADPAERYSNAEGMLKAGRIDLRSARLLYEHAEYSTAAYHMQQACEKVSKAYGMCFFQLSDQTVKKRVSHKTPLTFTEGAKRPYITSFIGVMKRFEPSLNTDLAGLERTINEKEGELARTNEEQIRRMFTLLDLVAERMRQAKLSDVVARILNDLRDIFPEEKQPNVDRLLGFLAQHDLAEFIMGFLSLYIISSVTYPHEKSRYHDSPHLKPEDYKPGLGVVDCMPDLLSRTEHAAKYLEIFLGYRDDTEKKKEKKD